MRAEEKVSPREPALPVRCALIIPALNEAESLPQVLDELPAGLYSRALVVDNGSTDGTAQAARAAGAEVVVEPARGYGRACLAGLSRLPPEIDIVVFMDADGSDVPAEAHKLIEPIMNGEADLVLGARLPQTAEPGAMRPAQRWGNGLAVALIRLLYGFRYSDMGPFRAIRHTSLRELEMQDPDFGWNAEMQVKALKKRLKVKEVPVHYRRRRGGHSKISGTLTGTVRAGYKILWTIFRLRFSD